MPLSKESATCTAACLAASVRIQETGCLNASGAGRAGDEADAISPAPDCDEIREPAPISASRLIRSLPNLPALAPNHNAIATVTEAAIAVNAWRVALRRVTAAAAGMVKISAKAGFLDSRFGAAGSSRRSKTGRTANRGKYNGASRRRGRSMDTGIMGPAGE